MGHRLERMVRLQVEDNKLTQEQIKLFTETFKIFDKDGSGAIDAQEFREVCETIGMTPTDTELELMMMDVDKNGSGDIDLDDNPHIECQAFCDFLENVLFVPGARQ